MNFVEGQEVLFVKYGHGLVKGTILNVSDSLIEVRCNLTDDWYLFNKHTLDGISNSTGKLYSSEKEYDDEVRILINRIEIRRIMFNMIHKQRIDSLTLEQSNDLLSVLKSIESQSKTGDGNIV